jgi:hypothetical protein
MPHPDHMRTKQDDLYAQAEQNRLPSGMTSEKGTEKGAIGGGQAHTRGEMTPPRAASRRYFPTSPFKPPLAPPPPDVFAVRDQVTHDKYGLGRVMSIEDGTSVIIDFRTRRVRILTPYARLTKL